VTGSHARRAMSAVQEQGRPVTGPVCPPPCIGRFLKIVLSCFICRDRKVSCRTGIV